MTIDGNAAQHGSNDDPAYVVFGYGSLIFRPPPHVIKESNVVFVSLLVAPERVPAPGFLKGYVRRFARNRTTTAVLPQVPDASSRSYIRKTGRPFLVRTRSRMKTSFGVRFNRPFAQAK
ncbi:hypothetical protein EI94DRAFT_1780173 [Lactarius quietus]|nr:hypothetical protein EI94DRAFT_1780173 [Lactarius quietus]